MIFLTHKSTMLACEFGITTQSAVNNLVPILFVIFKDDFGISYTMIANVMLFNFLIQIATDFTSIKILNCFGYRKSGILAQASAALGLILLGVLPQLVPIYPALFISTFFMAFGGGLLEVMVSPIVDSISDGQSSAKMNMLHSFFCWGQVAVILTATSAIKLLGNGVWQFLAIAWAIVPIISIFMFAVVPIPDIFGGEMHRIGNLSKSKVFLIMCLLMIASGASEITMAEWASVFAQKGLGIAKFSGDILGSCLFAVLMGTGRILFGFFGNKVKIKNALIFSAVLCTICYLTAATAKNPFIALFACALTGFSVSIMWPGVYSYSSSLIKTSKTAMFGILALCGDIGCSLGSWLAGTVSDFSLTFPKVLTFADKIGLSYEQIGLKIGIASVTIFPLLMAVLLILLKTHGNEV